MRYAAVLLLLLASGCVVDASELSGGERSVSRRHQLEAVAQCPVVAVGESAKGTLTSPLDIVFIVAAPGLF